MNLYLSVEMSLFDLKCVMFLEIKSSTGWENYLSSLHF